MGFDTKPNLNDNKFEQFSGEILSLSGCTDIYGKIEIKTSGSFVLADGTQGVDRVMTSDAAGKGTWDSTPYMTCGANGLCSIGHNVVLGGTLTGNTDICINNHQLSLGRTSDETRLTISQSFPYIISEVCENSFSLLGNCICINAQVGATKSGMIFYYDCNTWSSDCMLLTSSGFTFTDNNNSGGMKYLSNYCNDFVDRSLVDKEYVDAAIGGGTGSAYDSENVTKEVSQNSHGFAVKDFIGWSGGTYNKAIASGDYDGEFVGLVSEVSDGNTFKVTQSGYISGLTGVVIDTTYFLSENTAGLITSTQPSGDGEINKAVFVADSTTSGWVLPYVGNIITTGTTSISTANNGLTDNGGIVQLGGALCQTTTISGLDSYDLQITGNWMKYTGDYSAGIGLRDIPDVDWITGNTGIGNINWNGTTANGIGTYVDADTICSEPNLTWDGDVLGIAGDGTPKCICVVASTTPSTLTVVAGTSTDGSAAGFLNLKAGSNTSTGFGGFVHICGGCADNNAGNVFICGGCSTSTTGGSVTIRSGVGSTDGTVNICHGLTKRLNTTTTGVKITGGFAITNPATKSTETNILYIADDGTVASGATSGGASYWSGDTYGISNSGLTNVGIGVVSNVNYGLSLYNKDRYGMCITNCLNGTYDPSVAYASNLLINNEYNGTTTQQNFTNIYLQAHGTTAGGQNYHATLNAVHALCANHEGFLAIQGRRSSSVTSEMMRLCNCTSGVIIYTCGVHCATTAFRATGTGYRYCGGTGCGTAVDWVATCDCRIKKNITPITSALSKVDALCGVCYNLCEDNTPDMGLIAQDVQCVEPRLVAHGEPIEEYKKYGIEDEILSLKYDKFAGLLVEAVKELKEQNICLQNQINELRKNK